MFWLALLALAVVGFNRPRRALQDKLKAAPDDLLKVLGFIGLFLFIVFGLLDAGSGASFLVLLLPAFGALLGALATIEQTIRKKLPQSSESVTDSIKVDAFWQKREQQRPARPAPSRDDPWGVLAAQRGAEQRARRKPVLPAHKPVSQVEPVIEPYATGEPADTGLEFYVPGPMPARQAVPAAKPKQEPAAKRTAPDPRAGLVSLLKRQVQAQAARDGEAATSAGAAPTATPAPATAQQAPPATPELVPEQGANAWHMEESPALEFDPEIAADKQELEVQAQERKEGRYKYKPQLVKSLFTSDED